MGLIMAAIGAAAGTMADQWKEYFYCEALPDEVLMVKGQKVVTGRGQNTKGNDNIISAGSGVAVADGQTMIIVEDGAIIEVCNRPGRYTFELGTPSLFADGKLGTKIKETFKQIGQRIGYGGDPGKDQRVYYFNTKQISNNLFGTPEVVPFRVVDSKIGLDVDVSIKCSGMYTFQIVDPLLFYTNICGNQAVEYKRETIAPRMKAEFIDALTPAFSTLSDMEIRPNQIPGKKTELKNAVNTALADTWGKNMGIEVVEVAIKALNLPKEDQEMIKQAQQESQKLFMEGRRMSMYADPTMAAGGLVAAQGDAMRAAGSNAAGAMTGFMGVNMAQQAGGMNAQQLFAMGQQQAAQQQAAAPAGDSWTCSCGTTNTSKFCQNCGSPKPAPAAENGWTCSCGTVNQGKFCQNCGSPKPAGAKVYKCDKCGWTPADPSNPPKFCPECGDVFDDNDATN
ncbi:SPFH domain-containing protein [Ruminococcus albus]|uniref:Membrane protease subunit, stomatin/prohibitin family, contains C-terminal Zn-ribbon domain n=1 Tax=Ruminococcus albus TaxID=1264 RepID=A0A1H7JDS2_RUMAL|nr:SPFH domain-containing protein [Ruminococcus albus]SEK72584.1 Membrane protease subunit, stomatin/prohibitin family, contains C-terminal Zn-ribbon domain [Ruminococcus albus]